MSPNGPSEFQPFRRTTHPKITSLFHCMSLKCTDLFIILVLFEISSAEGSCDRYKNVCEVRHNLNEKQPLKEEQKKSLVVFVEIVFLANYGGVART